MIINEYAIEYLRRDADERLTEELERRRVQLERLQDEPVRPPRSSFGWFRLGQHAPRSAAPTRRPAH